MKKIASGSEGLNFETLKPYQKRSFVPSDADLTDLNQMTALYSRLLDRDVTSPKEFEKWILDRSELEAVADQQGSVLYIRMTCQTDDPKRAEEYTKFIETIVPAMKPLEDRLNRKHLQLAEMFPLDESRYGIYNREIRSDIELFTEKNVTLETQLDLLSQDYQHLCGAMTVEYKGKERTLPEMSKFLQETIREEREAAWRAITQRRLRDRDALDTLFDKMVALRHQVAKNAGMDNYCDYKFKALHRFDYTPRECFAYHDAVARAVVPLWRKLLERRREVMGLERLRPWDTAVDPLGRSPLKPFEQVEGLISGCQKIYHKVDGTLGRQFDELVQDGLLDLQSRKGKAPGGYQTALGEARKPFIFMNAVGVDHDVRTLLHESGHAFHSLACAHDPLLDYRHGPMEFNEVASMSMELLADRHLDVFYNPADMERSSQKHLEDIIFTLVWVAIIDAFQHWIYLNPSHTVMERRSKWLEIHGRFHGGVVDWDGLEEEHAYLWHQQLHVFEVPFYYIEYGIAQIGALQIWLNSKSQWRRTLEQYQNGLRLGGSKPLPELFKAAGIRFDFSEKTLRPLMGALAHELLLA